MDYVIYCWDLCREAVGVLVLAGILGILLRLLFAKILDTAADILCGLVFLWSRGATTAAVLLQNLPAVVTPVAGVAEGVVLLEVCCSFAVFSCYSLLFAITSLHSGNSWAYALNAALFWLIMSTKAVTVSFLMLSTSHPVYPKALSITHLNVCPWKAPNCISYSDNTSVLSLVLPPLFCTAWCLPQANIQMGNWECFGVYRMACR